MLVDGLGESHEELGFPGGTGDEPDGRHPLLVNVFADIRRQLGQNGLPTFLDTAGILRLRHGGCGRAVSVRDLIASSGRRHCGCTGLLCGGCSRRLHAVGLRTGCTGCLCFRRPHACHSMVRQWRGRSLLACRRLSVCIA